MQHLRRSPWQQIQQRRTQRVLDNPTTDQKKKGMLAQKVPIPASLSDLEDGRGAGVTGCYQGGYPGSIIFVHIYHVPSSPTHTLVQATIISLAGASSPVSHFFLPSPLAIHHTAPSLKSDHAPSLLQTSDSLLTPGPRAICPPSSVPFAHSAPATPPWIPPGTFPPQGLCLGCSLCWVHSSPR